MTTEVPVTTAPQRARVLGVRVDSVDMDEAVAMIEKAMTERRPAQVVTADAYMVMTARENPDLRAMLEAAELVTPDGSGVVWALTRQGIAAQRVSGADLALKLIARSAEKGYRVFLLGASPGIAELAAEKLRLRFPGCNIVGARHGYFPAESDDVVASEIVQFAPDLLLVGMGIPRQEQFIRVALPILGHGVAMGVGGSFDVYSGKVRRAPALIRALRLEWLWRVLLDPKKIYKVKHLPRYARLVLQEKR